MCRFYMYRTIPVIILAFFLKGQLLPAQSFQEEEHKPGLTFGLNVLPLIAVSGVDFFLEIPIEKRQSIIGAARLRINSRGYERYEFGYNHMSSYGLEGKYRLYFNANPPDERPSDYFRIFPAFQGFCNVSMTLDHAITEDRYKSTMGNSFRIFGIGASVGLRIHFNSSLVMDMEIGLGAISYPSIYGDASWHPMPKGALTLGLQGKNK